MKDNPDTISLMEDVYEVLAEAIDRIPEQQGELFLTKLALLMAREIGDVTRFKSLTEAATLDL
jgi:hypothetical protein